MGLLVNGAKYRGRFPNLSRFPAMSQLSLRARRGEPRIGHDFKLGAILRDTARGEAIVSVETGLEILSHAGAGRQECAALRGFSVVQQAAVSSPLQPIRCN